MINDMGGWWKLNIAVFGNSNAIMQVGVCLVPYVFKDVVTVSCMFLFMSMLCFMFVFVSVGVLIDLIKVLCLGSWDLSRDSGCGCWVWYGESHFLSSLLSGPNQQVLGVYVVFVPITVVLPTHLRSFFDKG
jgi:hypothetical protein